MDRRLIAINQVRAWETPTEEMIELTHKAGFDGMFQLYDGRNTPQEFKKWLDERHMIFQSIHVLWRQTPGIWEDPTEDGEAGVKEYMRCLEDCADVEVPIMVAHSIQGMKKHTPTELGMERFGRIFRRAEELGVTVAMENVEGPEYLDLLYRTYKDSPAFGYTWDSGHEMCYGHGENFLAKYGDRLVATHLNDNLGCTTLDGSIAWTDDLHLLPFDGIIDWKERAERIRKVGYEGILTFELLAKSKPDKHESDLYFQMGPEVFLAEAWKRAMRVAALI